MQNILVIAALLLAIFYLGRQFYIRFFSTKNKCESCAFSREIHSKKA